ncbi:hypothetical protein [Clostridium beijerinckii]|nr:hypothetical protein [Clostridium beijerinckii]
MGSEVTNVSVLELKENAMKMSIATDELYSDSAIMITELFIS